MYKESRFIGMTMACAAVLMLAACALRQPAESFRLKENPSGSGSSLSSGGGSGTTTDFTNEATPTTPDSLETVKTGSTAHLTVTLTGSAIIIGNSDAPADLILFSGYDCLYCRQFAIEDLSWLEQTYVATGKMRLVRAFLPMTPDGKHAAKASICAAVQGKFREADRLLWVQPNSLGADTSGFVKTLKLKKKAFDQCLDGTDANDIIVNQAALAQKRQIERVPAFILGTSSWIGVATRDELARTIDAALKQ